MKNILLSAFIFFQITTVFSKAQPEKIIDDNELTIVDSTATNIPFKYQKIINAFGGVMYNQHDADGKLEDAFYGCTGTHMGGGYVITAGHCVGATAQVTSHKNCHFIANEDALETPNVIIKTIDFGYRDHLIPFMKSECQEIIAAMQDEKTGFDFAILKVSPYPSESILPDMSRRSVMGDTITIFSHPNGEVLQWSKTCGVERILHPDLTESYIQHKCDTKPGSSGAAIINALSLKIVGIHDGGLNDLDHVTGVPLKTGMNYGTYILNSPLYEELKKIGF